MRIVAAILVAAAGLAASAGIGEASPVNIGSGKQLFIDDALIASSQGMTLAMNPPRKTGERCIVPDRPWEGYGVCAYNAVVEDEGIYKMWYDAIDNDGGRWLCYATSTDGIRWDKPALGIVDFRGSNDNNIVFPPEKRTHEPGCVFVDTNPKCPPSARYKMVCSYDGPGGFGTYVGESPDGLHWRLLSDKPSFRGSDTGNVAFWDDRIGRYVAYIRTWTPMRMVGRCEFDDLVDFGKEEVVFGYDEQDPPDIDFYTNAAIKYPFAESVYLIFPSAYFHYPEPPVGKFSNDGPLDIRFAVSRDGVNFTRPDRSPYIGLGTKGSFDDSAMYMTTGLIRSGGEIWQYYIGYDFTHGAYHVATDRFKGAISRVVQRLDGYVSADAAYGGGELTTVPIIFAGKQLELNVDTGVAGSAQVEILDGEGTPVPGFALADADVIKGNYIARTVTWQGSDDVSALAGKPVQLHFVMRDAKLYAFQFQEQAGSGQ
ncbi:MAG: hypothetical protein JSV65_08105 [Armatimonadota bacterium]|nr:MAG: hypothetical protein JSV65_08105 [Armatimonadota bacterium]